MDIYCDIDGTVANAEHRIHFVKGTGKKDWKKFFEELKNDTPITEIVYVINLLYGQGNRIIMCSGRPEDHREATEQWLANVPVYHDALYMRPAGDYRSDDIVKIELLQKIRADGYDPVIAFDDRQRVVDALRANGVRVLQVAAGDF